jgi:hypothetical protein
MSERNRLRLFVACLFVLALGTLSILGATLGSNFDTFIPDLIIGVVGAGLIAFIVAVAQERSESSRGKADRTTAAYENLYSAIAPLRIADFEGDGPGEELSTVITRMITFVDVVDDGHLEEWLEAERQLGLIRGSRADEETRRLKAQDGGATRDALFEARAPFNQWAALLGDNLRYWRTGKMTPDEMRGQIERIRALVEQLGPPRP